MADCAVEELAVQLVYTICSHRKTQVHFGCKPGTDEAVLSRYEVESRIARDEARLKELERLLADEATYAQKHATLTTSVSTRI